MKESILRAAAIAAMALALIMAITTWIGVSSSPTRGSFFMGFFEFALILFLGGVAWALLNALADAAANRTTLEMLTMRMVKIETALGRLAPGESDQGQSDQGQSGQAELGRAGANAGSTAGSKASAAPGAAATEAAPPADEADMTGEERR